MNRRTGLGRHGHIEGAVGDPLDGLVNLFDIGIVLAVAFLIAGLGLTVERRAHRIQAPTPRAQHTQAVPSPSSDAPLARGHGEPVGTVYRLSGGRLVYVQKQP
jgi:hypothetical protein